MGLCMLLIFLERETGLEPVTSSLGSWHSTTELLPLGFDPQCSKNGDGFPSIQLRTDVPRSSST